MARKVVKFTTFLDISGHSLGAALVYLTVLTSKCHKISVFSDKKWTTFLSRVFLLGFRVVKLGSFSGILGPDIWQNRALFRENDRKWRKMALFQEMAEITLKNGRNGILIPVFPKVRYGMK